MGTKYYFIFCKKLMERLNHYIKNRIYILNHTNLNFGNLFNIMYDQPDKTFIEYQDKYKIKKVSYLEFKSYVLKTATFYEKLIKDEKNTYVGILLDNSLTWFSSFWAVLALGYNPVLLNTKLPCKINNYVIKSLNLKTIISSCELITGLDVDNKILIKNSFGLDKDIESLAEYNPLTFGDKFALNTTATSLNVKICVYNAEDLKYQILNAEGIIKKNKLIKAHYKGSLKQLLFLPMYHVFGLFATYFWFAYFGRTFVLLKDLSGDTIFKTVRRHNVTHIFAVPLLWNTIAREINNKISHLDDKKQAKFKKGLKLSYNLQRILPHAGRHIALKMFNEITENTFGKSIKFLISGGGYISKENLYLFNAIGYPLLNGYGSTEVGITSVVLSNNIKGRISDSVGKAFKYVNYKVEESTLKIKCGSMSSLIYYSDGSSKTFSKEDWFDTKDNCFIDKRGNTYILGRSDDVIISNNGEKINPDIIEREIKLLNVKNYSIIDYKNEIALIIEISHNNPLMLKKIYDEVKKEVEKINKLGYSINKIFYSETPILNKNAIKVSRTILKNKINDGTVSLKPFDNLTEKINVSNEELHSVIEQKVIEVFANVLDIDINIISKKSNFTLDLGGSSLDVYSCLIKLKEEFNMEFVFTKDTFSTAEEISKYILNQTKGE